MQRLPPSNVHMDPGFIIKQYGSNVTMKFVSVNTDRIIEVNIFDQFMPKKALSFFFVLIVCLLFP
jgi:hypothetical protein